MTANYKPLSPDSYPIQWNSAAQSPAALAGQWVSADWARTESAAVQRMKRMRAFRDGMREFPAACPPTITAAIAAGRMLSFRKVLAGAAGGVWDVQMSWAAPPPAFQVSNQGE